MDRPHPASYVDSACRLQVLGAEILPPIELLDAYAEQIVERQSEADAVASSVRGAEGREASYQAALSAPSALLAQANRLMSGSCRRDLRALNRLLAKDPPVRSDDERATIAALAGTGLVERTTDDRPLTGDQICPLFSSDALATQTPSDCSERAASTVESLPVAGSIAYHVESAWQLYCTAIDVRQGLPSSIVCEGRDAALCDAKISGIWLDLNLTAARA